LPEIKTLAALGAPRFMTLRGPVVAQTL